MLETSGRGIPGMLLKYPSPKFFTLHQLMFTFVSNHHNLLFRYSYLINLILIIHVPSVLSGNQLLTPLLSLCQENSVTRFMRSNGMENTTRADSLTLTKGGNVTKKRGTIASPKIFDSAPSIPVSCTYSLSFVVNSLLVRATFYHFAHDVTFEKSLA